MELLTRHRHLDVADDLEVDHRVAVSARVVQIVATLVAVAMGVVAWATPGIGPYATVVVVLAIAVAAAARWPERH